MKNNGRHLITVTALVAIATYPVYKLLTAIYQFPVAASVQADKTKPLFDVQFMLISFLFSLIMVFILYSALVFRRKPGDDEEGAYFHGHTALEIAWTILPLIVVIALGIWSLAILNEVTAEEPDEMVVEVLGRQWSWAFSYPDYEEIGFTNEMVLPVNQAILLQLRSQDVLHSFWVPEFGVKQDLVPGMVQELRVTPNKTGEYTIGCAEICGLSHALMVSKVRVVSEAAFTDWVAEQSGAEDVPLSALSPEERGAKWAVDFGCQGCHSIDGSDPVGPSWLDLFGSQESLTDGATVTVDEEYLQESILKPALRITAGFETIAMPENFAERFAAGEADVLAEEGIEVDMMADLIAYIESLAE